jgi:hypothetical protein
MPTCIEIKHPFIKAKAEGCLPSKQNKFITSYRYISNYQTYLNCINIRPDKQCDLDHTSDSI